MKIQLVDHIVFADYSDLQMDNAVVDQIVNHTKETWQPKRETAERGRNTRQGKIAKTIVETFIENYFRDEISMKVYDDIRNDNYKKHAPFDFLIWKSGEVDIAPVEAAVRNDISTARNESVQLSKYTRELCRKLNVKIVEVKSTKIREKLKREARFEGNYKDIASVKRLADTIRRTDDVFCYPHYKRSETDNKYSINEYCRYVKSIEPSLAIYEGEELRKKVIELEAQKQWCDIFVRVYVDPTAKKGLVIGWMPKERLLDHAVLFKRMWQEDKSERALYFAKNLQKTESIENISRLFE